MNLAGKVALVAGGASGIGEKCVEELLQNNIKGVVIADINAALGKEVVRKFNEEFGNGKVVFQETDVSNKDSFEGAFVKAVATYGNLDILINSAGISNEIQWEKTIQINLVGTTYGCLLAINKYFPNHKSGKETHIVNIASISGLVPAPFGPHYASSKYGVIGLTKSLGSNKYITKNGTYIMAICPGITKTPMLTPSLDTLIYNDLFEEVLSRVKIQEPSIVGKALIKALNEAENGAVWVVDKDIIDKVAPYKLDIWRSKI